MDGYELVALLRTGGQGEVWRAVDDDGAEVAVKVMQLARGLDNEQPEREARRFQREIAAQSELSHDGIVPVLASGVEGDRPWYAMPLADGSLRDLFVLNTSGLEETEAVRVFGAILEAVVFAHREGAIHRDLKPENVLMFGDRPRLSDFGLVRRLHSGSSTITFADGLGSTKYAAPEQLEDGHIVDERADIYSLGCILFEMLTGRPFFPHRNLQLAPQKFRSIIHKATELDQEHRFASSMEMSRAFRMTATDLQRLQSASSRASALIGPMETGRSTPADVAALAQILIEHSDDPQLLLYTFGRSLPVVVELLVAHEPAALKPILRSFTELAEHESFDWDYVDVLGRFMCAAIRATPDVDNRIVLFRGLLRVAHSHNRYRVRTMWIKAAQGAMTDPTFVPVIADVIHSNPECKDFLRAEMLVESLPPVVADELAA